MRKIIEKTNGKKTESVGVLMVVFQMFVILYPDLLSDKSVSAINLAIGSGAVGTIGHRVWRNRKKYWGAIKRTFQKQNRKRD